MFCVLFASVAHQIVKGRVLPRPYILSSLRTQHSMEDPELSLNLNATVSLSARPCVMSILVSGSKLNLFSLLLFYLESH